MYVGFAFPLNNYMKTNWQVCLSESNVDNELGFVSCQGVGIDNHQTRTPKILSPTIADHNLQYF